MTRNDIVQIHDAIDLDAPESRIEAAGRLLSLSGQKNATAVNVAQSTGILTAFLQQLLDADLYIEAALLSWGDKLFDPRPRSVQMVWSALLRHPKNLFMGASSLGKSYNIAAFLKLRWTEDPWGTNIKVVSTSGKHAVANMWSTICEFHLKSAIPVPGELTATEITIDPRNKQAAISVVALPVGDDGKGRLQGFHPKPRERAHHKFGPSTVVMLALDEGEDAPNGIWQGVDNMLATQDEHGSVKIASATNPKNIGSVFAQKAMPIGGWQNFSLETSEEWESEEGFHVTRLDASKTENVIARKIIYPGLQTYEGYMNLLKRGRSDPSVWTFAWGAYPMESVEYQVIPPILLRTMTGLFTWAEPPTNWGSFDGAFAEGGDSPIFTTGQYGQASSFKNQNGEVEVFPKPKWVVFIEQQFPIERKYSDGKVNAILMAEELIRLCGELLISPEFFVTDKTGNGLGVHDYLKLRFGDILGTEWGEAATDKKILDEDTKTADEQFSGVVSEMWFAFRQWAEVGAIKFAPMLNTSMMARQMTSRKYSWVSKTMRRVEGKPEFKSRNQGQSPDESDSAIQGLHLIRMRGESRPAMIVGGSKAKVAVNVYAEFGGVDPWKRPSETYSESPFDKVEFIDT